MAQIPKLLQPPTNQDMGNIAKAVTGQDLFKKVSSDLGEMKGALKSIDKTLKTSAASQKQTNDILKRLVSTSRQAASEQRRAKLKEPKPEKGKEETGPSYFAAFADVLLGKKVQKAPQREEAAAQPAPAPQPSLLGAVADVAANIPDFPDRPQPRPTTTVPESRPTTQPRPAPTGPESRPTTPPRPAPTGPSIWQRAGQAIMTAGRAAAPVAIPATVAAAGGAVIGSVLAEADKKSQEENKITIEQRQSQIPGQESANRQAAIAALAKGGVTPDKMKPEDYEEAVQAQMAREARMAARRARPNQPSGVREAANRQAEALPGVETPAQNIPQMAANAESTSTVTSAQQIQRQSSQIQFSEYKFSQADPENYKKFIEARKKKEEEIYAEMIKSYGGEKAQPETRRTIKEVARKKASTQTIIQFRKEIEAAGAGSVKTEGEPTVTPQRQQPTSMRVEETSTFDAGALAEKDPETHAKFVARQREIVKEKEAELEKRSDLSPMAKNVERQRIQAQAFETAAREFTPQAAHVGAASVSTSSATQPPQPQPAQVQPQPAASRMINTMSDFSDVPPAPAEPRERTTPDVGAMSVQNQDLQRQQTQGQQVVPVVVNNNNSATERVVSAPAQPRVDSTFSRIQESRFMPAW
jgi:hypothetical protein